mgnify:CR=1 FL=1
MVLEFTKRMNYYEKDFVLRFNPLPRCLKTFSQFFVVPIATLNKLYKESDNTFKSIYRYLYELEIYRRWRLLPKSKKSRKLILEKSFKIDYFPDDLI